MSDDPTLELLDNIGGWEGFEVAAIRREGDLQPDVLGLPSERICYRVESEGWSGEALQPLRLGRNRDS